MATPQMPAARRATDLVSPRAHALLDLLAFPLMLGTVAWAARRSKPAAAVILANALGEGLMNSITRGFPAQVWPLVSFRTHVRVGQFGGPVFLALSYLVPRTTPAERRVAIGWGLVPIVLNGLSDISGQPPRATQAQPS